MRKVLNLLYIGIFCSLCVFFAELYFFGVESNLISLAQIFFKNWYFREYLILFLLSPFLNALFEDTSAENLKKTVLPLALLFTWNFLAAQLPSSFGQTESLGNHTAMLLVMMYLLGRSLSTSGVLQKIAAWILAVVLCACLPFVFWFARLKDFSSPFCILAAICLFELFRRLPLPLFVSKAACFISPSMLGILILHNAGSHKISGGLVHRYFENFSGNLGGAVFLKYAVIIFGGGLAVDLVRRSLSFVVVKLAGDIKK